MIFILSLLVEGGGRGGGFCSNQLHILTTVVRSGQSQANSYSQLKPVFHKLIKCPEDEVGATCVQLCSRGRQPQAHRVEGGGGLRWREWGLGWGGQSGRLVSKVLLHVSERSESVQKQRSIDNIAPYKNAQSFNYRWTRALPIYFRVIGMYM